MRKFWSTVAEFLVFRPSEIATSVALVALGKHYSSVLESVATYRKELRKVLHTCHHNPEMHWIIHSILKQLVYALISSNLYLLNWFMYTQYIVGKSIGML